MPDKWWPRLRTARAMALLTWARLLVAAVPMERWRHTLGSNEPDDRPDGRLENARRVAADIEWAAKRLPFSTKCLPRAIALSWMLRRRKTGHAVVIAVRPVAFRETPDALHAWVEINGQKILGDLPGPWVETLRQGA